MIIKRIVQESSIDYPGKYGPVIFISGCNFRCKFCHNPELINLDGEKDFDIESELKIIKIKAESGWYNGVCISGGEPLLYREVEKLAAGFKALGLAVKIDTNGSNPGFLAELIEKSLVDYVALDIKTDKENYSKITGIDVDLKNIEKTIKILAESGIRFELRTTIIPVFDKEWRWMSLDEIRKMEAWVFSIANKRVSWVLQPFVARDKGELLDDSYCKDNLPGEFQETPKSLLLEMKKILDNGFKCEIR